jgi:hypothetical protein
MPKSVPKEVVLVREHKLDKITKEDSSVSYSQFLSYKTCPHQWYLRYVRKLGTYEPSIHTVFGTAMHEVIQEWLTVMYEKTVKQAMEIDLAEELQNKLKSVYKREKARSGHDHFSDAEQMNSFYEDGVQILDYFKKHRNEYFSSKNTYLVKVELPLVQELRSNLFFKGYVDLVLYNEVSGFYTILDIKTSTKGWNEYAKKDENKVSQIILYKEFFSKQFNVDPEKIYVNFIILKRQIPVNPEFASMGKRIQEFTPPSGKIKRAQVVKQLKAFVDDAFNETGEPIDKEYTKNACKSSCMFCEFKTNKYLCNQAVL